LTIALFATRETHSTAEQDRLKIAAMKTVKAEFAKRIGALGRRAGGARIWSRGLFA
jgi:hypothetical protein